MTQKEIIKKKLREDEEVSRNWALDRRITRLSAIILNLKEEGYDIEGKWRGNDYVYFLIDVPKRTVYRPKHNADGSVSLFPNIERV